LDDKLIIGNYQLASLDCGRYSGGVPIHCRTWI